MSNPIQQYMADKNVGTVDMAKALGVSKGYASQLKDGDKPITPRVARALAKLTGEPWWTYVPETPETEAAQ